MQKQPQVFNGLSNAVSSGHQLEIFSSNGLASAQANQHPQYYQTLQTPMHHQPPIQLQSQPSLSNHQAQLQQQQQQQQQLQQQLQQQQIHQQQQFQQSQQQNQIQHQQQMYHQQQQQQQYQTQQFMPQQTPMSVPQMMGFASRGTRGLAKKKLSPFLVYVKHRKPVLEQERPEIAMKEILQVVGQEWHRLTEDQKNIYRDESERDKMLADQQLGIPPQLSKSKIHRGGSLMGVDQNGQVVQIKKALTPYMCFLKEQKHLLSQQHSEIVMKEFVRLGAQKWQTMTEDDKEPYRRLADVDRVRHEREKQSILQKGNTNSDMDLQLAQMHLAQRVSQNYKPIIHINDISTIVQPGGMPQLSQISLLTQNQNQYNNNNTILDQGQQQQQQQQPQQLNQTSQTQNSTQASPQVQIIQRNLGVIVQQLEQLDQTKPKPPNSVLFYFDQEKRQEILERERPQTAEHAFELIKTTFESQPEHERQRFENMAIQDHQRFRKEDQELIGRKEQLSNAKLSLETQLKQILSQAGQKLSSTQQNLIGQPANIMGHPFVFQLQQVIQNQQQLLVQQASLIQNILSCLKANGIQIESLQGFQNINGLSTAAVHANVDGSINSDTITKSDSHSPLKQDPKLNEIGNQIQPDAENLNDNPMQIQSINQNLPGELENQNPFICAEQEEQMQQEGNDQEMLDTAEMENFAEELAHENHQKIGNLLELENINELNEDEEEQLDTNILDEVKTEVIDNLAEDQLDNQDGEELEQHQEEAEDLEENEEDEN
ncbi:UNKNOWN [Stylonychia lemnae]|uniref:HMG box domain-containing protein n=1 Tax=Stylonychia lemnae TaxID=5949 RepID=A0A078B5J0_STYLE|nr:UNKNOWN [Stylonychia lemnae]|eukprot:CDW88788.1 UNKNOWN [Stylonychia lemnae]